MIIITIIICRQLAFHLEDEVGRREVRVHYANNIKGTQTL